MRARTLWLKAAALTLLTLGLSLVTSPAVADKGRLTVHFIDVGQADSILVQTPTGQNILVDGGNTSDADTVVTYLKQHSVSKLAAVVATHPHEDHIGGLSTVLRSFPVSAFYMPAVSANTLAFEDLIQAANDSGATKIQVKPGVSIPGLGITCVFLGPVRTTYEDLNDCSAVLKITYGKTSFLLTGDAEAQAEADMIAAKQDLKATVLKVAHHGSDSSTTEKFLAAVSPKYAVISVGAGNPYGHPSQTVLTRLANKKVTVYRTDQHGTIVSESDGTNVTFKVAKPASLSQAPPSNSSNSDVIVYITRTGSKYHRAGCRYLARSQIPLKLSEAKALGYTPCSVCRPPQ